ncbi:hypothetical protein QJS66_01125 [Kocuria rhizophila]|nr:hypothetical protein QJS66_01125 [Kocuria rhizophila]
MTARGVPPRCPAHRGRPQRTVGWVPHGPSGALQQAGDRSSPARPVLVGSAGRFGSTGGRAVGSGAVISPAEPVGEAAPGRLVWRAVGGWHEELATARSRADRPSGLLDGSCAEPRAPTTAAPAAQATVQSPSRGAHRANADRGSAEPLLRDYPAAQVRLTGGGGHTVPRRTR